MQRASSVSFWSVRCSSIPRIEGDRASIQPIDYCNDPGSIGNNRWGKVRPCVFNRVYPSISIAMEALKQLQTPRGMLYAIAACIAVMHVAYIWQADDTELFGTSVLLWAAAGTLLWEKRDRLKLESDAFSSAVGAGLIVLVILRSFSLAGYHLRFSPIMAFLGLCLLATRARHLGTYWRELLILTLLALGKVFHVALEAVDLPTITATFSTFSLWYAGFDVAREGTFIILPEGRVEVYGACSGVASVIQMFNIAILLNLLMPLSWWKRGVAVIAATIVGFVVNAGRVGVMAFLVAADNREAFDFWHEGDGSTIFFVVSVLLFALFCWAFILRESAAEPEVVAEFADGTPEGSWQSDNPEDR